MALISQLDLDNYLLQVSAAQRESILEVRSWILELGAPLDEVIDQGNWFGGLLTYSVEGHFLFALGPRSGDRTTLHMMPLYALKDLALRNGPSLKRFLTGKSCIQFLDSRQLPKTAIQDILGSWEACVDSMKAYAEKRSKPSRTRAVKA